MTKEVSITIQLKASDMFHFLMRHTYTSFSGIFGVFLSCGALVLLMIGFQTNDPLNNIILIFMSTLFLIINPIQLKFKAARQIKTNPMFQKPLNYKINQEGLLAAQGEEEVVVKWEEVRKIVETGKCIIIYLSPVRAFIFPREQYQEQYEMVKGIICDNTEKRICKWRK